MMVDDRLQLNLGEVINQFHARAAKLSGQKLSDEVISDATVDKAKQSTVKITVSSVDGPRGYGSGFIVGSGNEIVTNLHVIGDARSIDITTPSGEHFAARVTKVDEFSDLALLKVDGMSADSSRAVKFGSTADLTRYSKLFTVGHPNGVDRSEVSQGTFRAMSTYGELIPKYEADQWRKVVPVLYGKYAFGKAYIPEAEKYLATSRVAAALQIDHGNSGGLVQNAKGETIGVATNVSPQRQGQAFLVPSENVVSLLNSPNSRFSFNYEKETNFDRDPLLTAGKDAALLGLGYKFRPVAAPLLGAAYSIDLYNDLKMATSSNLYGNRSDYVRNAAIDAAAVTGGVLSLVPKARMVGYGLVGARVLYEVGSDFLKGDPVLNHVNRTDAAQPQRSGEPLYWSLPDRVNANSERVAPRSASSIQGSMQGLRTGRH